MKIHIGRIAALLILFFCGTALHAQVKKHKIPDPAEKAKEFPSKYKRDTSHKPDPFLHVKSKKIAMEIPCDSNATVFLHNIMRRINILTSTSKKVRLVTTVYYQGTSSLTDSQWLSKLEMNITKTGNDVEIRSGDFPKNPAQGNRPAQPSNRLDTIFNGITVLDSLGNALGRRSSSDPVITLYVPAGAKLDIESKYADISVENNMREVKAKINNGGLTLLNAAQFRATGVYGTIYAGNIGYAAVDVTNGKLTAKNIDTLDISSKNSSVVFNKADLVNIRSSQADQFEIEEVQTITGQKAYGNLRLTTLTGSMDISGINADTKIKHINPSAKAVKINTRYADLGLPVSNLKNYTVAFEGAGGNVYAPFKKTAVTDASFKTLVGNGNEKPTVFRVICSNCSVDFN